jgi:hypothetical protein
MIDKAGKLLVLIMITELCLGGGGRFTAIDMVSFRMVLFALALAMSVVLLIRGGLTIPDEMRRLMIGFTVVMFIGVAVGVANGSSYSYWFEDIKPLSYFFVFPFFYMAIEKASIPKIEKIIKVGSLLMAIGLVVLVVLIDSGFIRFLTFYQATEKSGELFYRGEVTFFYKGFLFLGIGTIFYYFTELSKWRFLIVSFLIIAIIVSVTRGLLLALALTFSIYFITVKSYLKTAVGFLFVLIILVWGSSLILSGSRLFDAEQNNISYQEANPNLLGDRKYSDDGRFWQIGQVIQSVSFSSALIGHGFGAGIPSRPIHMEISYLEILHKQGLVGLVFWIGLAASIFIQYRQAIPSPSANAFFFSVVFVFIESLTNQYINNPIGMSMLLLSWVSLNKIKA